MFPEKLKGVFDTIKKVGNAIKKFNETDDVFLQSPSTQAFIQYLEDKYPKEIPELWCSVKDYISEAHKSLLQNKVKKWVEFFEDITWIISKTKAETTQLKEKIITNEHVWTIQTVFQMASWEQSAIKNTIKTFVWLSTESKKEQFLQSLWISLAPQDISKQPTIKQEEVITPTINTIEENNNIDIKKIKEGIFASESQHEKDPYKANNSTSSAIGKYQFLWNSRKDKIKEITKITNEKDYINNPEQQEFFMDYVIQNIYLPKAKEYTNTYPTWKLPELIMLIHFKGEKWALDWIKDKKDNTITNNISIDKYITNFKKEYYV